MWEVGSRGEACRGTVQEGLVRPAGSCPVSSRGLRAGESGEGLETGSAGKGRADPAFGPQDNEQQQRPRAWTATRGPGPCWGPGQRASQAREAGEGKSQHMGQTGGGGGLGPPSSPCSGTFEVFHKGGPRRKAKGPGLAGPRVPRLPSAAAPTQAAPAGALEEPRSPPFALRPSPSEGVLGTRAAGSRLRLAEEQALCDEPGTSAVHSPACRD